jgi:hypothetical protein
MDTKFLLRIATLILFFITLNCSLAFAQQTTQEEVDEMMEVAISQMNEGNYEDANITFRKILRMKTVLPDDLSYLFAETLYMVNQIHNSRNFLDKYLRLAGPNGRYYTQAMDLRHSLDEEYELILVCKSCDSRGYLLQPCDVCDGEAKITNPCFYCRGVGVSRCEVCKGEGVTSSFNALGAPQYQTCTSCEGKGQAVCKVCQGEKVLSDPCPSCNGTHRKPGTEICEHETAAVGGRHRMVGTFE